MFTHRTVGSALNSEGVEGTKMGGTIMRIVASFFLACLFVPFVAASGSATEIQLTPTVQGSARDNGPQDGVFDVILPAPNDRQLVNNGFVDSRAVFEFNISAIPSGSQINSAVLQICISVPQDQALPPPQSRQIQLHGYAGNGILELADYAQDNLIDSRTLLPGEGFPSVSFDISSLLGNLLANAETFAGFNLREEPPPLANLLIMSAPCFGTNLLFIDVDFSPAKAAKALKEDGISELQDLVTSLTGLTPPSGVGNIMDAVENLDDAIAFLTASLASFELSDPNRLIVPLVALGEAFFFNEENAVEEIFDAIDSGMITNPAILAELENIVVNKILEADKIVAQTAIDDAFAFPGNPGDIADAEAEFATAEGQAAACTLPAFPGVPGPCDDAVGSFEDAWINAQRAVGVLIP